MHNVLKNGVQCFVIIAEKKHKKQFLALLGDHGAHGIQIVYGKGSMSPSAIAEAFGFETEQNKVLITCLMKTESAKEVIEILYHDYNFDQPNTGIAFGISLEGLAF